MIKIEKAIYPQRPYVLDYAKPAPTKATCRVCQKPIQLDFELRVGKYENSPSCDGMLPAWTHFDCFFDSTEESSYQVSSFTNFQLLKYEDQVKVKQKIGVKVSSSDLYVEQCKRFDGNQNKLVESGVTKEHLINLLKHNDQCYTDTPLKLQQQVADIITFGALKLCDYCKTGHFMFNHNHYVCTGHKSESVKCDNKTTTPARSKCVIPEKMKKIYPMFQQIKVFKVDRIIDDALIDQDTDMNPHIIHSPDTISTAFDKNVFKPTTKGNVYSDSTGSYSVMLCKASIETNKNSFYKLQVLTEMNNNERYFIFRAWGRIGTNRCGKKEDRNLSKTQALILFENKFKEKTENEWSTRKQFREKFMFYRIIDVEADFDDFEVFQFETNHTSELPDTVQNLMKIMFDQERMADEIQIGMDLKLPLGRLSEKQIKKSYKELDLLQREFRKRGGPSESELLKLSNRFYGLIPHNFGDASPPVICTPVMLAEKYEMLKNLENFNFAYKFTESVPEDVTNSKSYLDRIYEGLNTSIEPLVPESSEFRRLKEYAEKTEEWCNATRNVPSKTRVRNIFKLDRKNESKHFDSSIGNRVYLWHGSLLPNFVNILTQGLQVPSTNSPSNGYRLGKGIYFADAFSKSIFYCQSKNRTSDKLVVLLLLNEVALGDIKEVRVDHPTLPVDLSPKKSVKAVGAWRADPENASSLNEVLIPNGPLKNNNEETTAFSFNEYTVYKRNQIKLSYLLEVELIYGSLVD